jgi:hypothetical protein
MYRERGQADKRRKSFRKKHNQTHADELAPDHITSAVPSSSQPPELQLDNISEMELKALPDIIDQARAECYVHLQEDVIRACLCRLLEYTSPGAGRTPRTEQVQTLRRLIYCKGDTILVARTGFGKSLIFHAFSILTGLITLQIIPLSKLGDEQKEEIRRFACASPCLLTKQTKSQFKNLWACMIRGEFTHILLGPEQATAKAFRSVLKHQQFQLRVGLVAIDECHLVDQWSSFRPEFTMLGQLRTFLRKDIVWFGCSGTLDAEAEKKNLDCAGFRPLGTHEYQTQVFRTSINRDDISICVEPIPRRKLHCYDRLHFLLDEAVDATAQDITPERLWKTIVFIDGRHKVDRAATYFREVLLSKSSSFPADRRYSRDGEARRCVYDIVETFTAHVSEYDRDRRYQEFKSSTSSIRIMVATTSLGIGVNVPDIERVVVWRFPIDNSIPELWQRAGRGGRGEGRTSVAYIFLPHWAFDSEGCDRPVAASVPVAASEPVASSATASPNLPHPRQNRNMMSSHPARVHSRLSQSFTPGELSDTESELSLDGFESDSSGWSQVTINELVSGQKYWSSQEATNRANLSPAWKAICNGPCVRMAILQPLGQDLDAIRTSPDVCCNRCNPGLSLTAPMPPEARRPPNKPAANTRAGLAFKQIDAFAASQAEACYPNLGRRFPMHASAWMDEDCRMALARLCVRKVNTPWYDDVAKMGLSNLDEKAPLFRSWKRREECGELMLRELGGIAERVDSATVEKRLQKRRAGGSQQDPSGTTRNSQDQSGPIRNSQEFDQNGRSVTITPTSINRTQHDTIARQVARRRARHLQRELDREARQGQPSQSSQSEIQMTQWTPTEGIRSKSWRDTAVTGLHASSTPSLRPALSPVSSGEQSPSPDLLDIVQLTVDRLNLVRSVGTDSACPLTPETPERAVSLDIGACSQTEITPSKRRRPLTEMCPNTRRRLGFSPVTKSGRVRTATAKMAQLPSGSI